MRLALRLHQIERGSLPADLSALVAAGHLPAVPTDPYDGNAIRYRISPGEELRPPSTTSATQVIPVSTKDETVRVRAGQAILWSVGQNGTDEGGRQIPINPMTFGRTDDLVFLVPLPPAERKAP